MAGRPMARRLVASRRRNRHKGWTICKRCKQVISNDQMVELLRPSRSRGAWYCSMCAADLIGGTDE